MEYYESLTRLFQENACQNVVLQMSAMLFGPKYPNVEVLVSKVELNTTTVEKKTSFAIMITPLGINGTRKVYQSHSPNALYSIIRDNYFIPCLIQPSTHWGRVKTHTILQIFFKK